MSRPDVERMHHAIQHINLEEGQSLNLYRYANRVPLLFQPGACAITAAVAQTNWRPYGLNQSRGQLPTGPLTIMVHVASVWVPFTSESKEAIASYPEILTEIRKALQAVGRQLGTFLNRKKKVLAEDHRRQIFLRYLKEVARAVSRINGVDEEPLYEKLLTLAKSKTAAADLEFDELGQIIKPAEDSESGEGSSDEEAAIDEEPMGV